MTPPQATEERRDSTTHRMTRTARDAETARVARVARDAWIQPDRQTAGLGRSESERMFWQRVASGGTSAPGRGSALQESAELAVVTLLGVVVFGLGWAALEIESVPLHVLERSQVRFEEPKTSGTSGTSETSRTFEGSGAHTNRYDGIAAAGVGDRFYSRGRAGRLFHERHARERTAWIKTPSLQR